MAVLYLRAERFMCRHCGRVNYASQSDDMIGRTWRRQWKLERQLGDGWTRPKGMHGTTRGRLLDAIWRCEEIREDALEAYLSRIAGLLDRYSVGGSLKRQRNSRA